MKKMNWNRCLALMLTLVMVFGMLPTLALAEDAWTMADSEDGHKLYVRDADASAIPEDDGDETDDFKVLQEPVHLKVENEEQAIAEGGTWTLEDGEVEYMINGVAVEDDFDVDAATLAALTAAGGEASVTFKAIPDALWDALKAAYENEHPEDVVDTITITDIEVEAEYKKEDVDVEVDLHNDGAGNGWSKTYNLAPIVVDTYKVTYAFTGEVPTGAILPVDEGEYEAEANVALLPPGGSYDGYSYTVQLPEGVVVNPEGGSFPMPAQDVTVTYVWTKNPDPVPEPIPTPTPDTDPEQLEKTLLTIGGRDVTTMDYGIHFEYEADGREKDVDAYNAKVGQELVWQIKVTNIGDENLDGLTIVDELIRDAEQEGNVDSQITEGISISPNPTEAFALAPNAFKIFTVTYVIQDADFGYELENKAILMQGEEKLDEADSDGEVYVNEQKEVPPAPDNDDWRDDEQTDEEDEDAKTGGDGVPDTQQVLIEFVTADPLTGTVTGKIVQVFTLETVEDDKYIGTVTPEAVTTVPAEKYAFDIWTRDNGTEAVNPFQEIDVQGGDHIIFKAHFAHDVMGINDGGDGIPDQYQGTVTYRVVNGTWSDETEADIVKVFTMKVKDKTTGTWKDVEPAPKLGETVPTGMKPNTGYEGGSWEEDKVPAADTVVVPGTVYVYTFVPSAPGPDPVEAWTVEKNLVSIGQWTIAEHENDPIPKAKVGETVTWEIVVTNTGNTELKDLKVSDKLTIAGEDTTLPIANPKFDLGLTETTKTKTFLVSYVVQEKDLGKRLSNQASVGDVSVHNELVEAESRDPKLTVTKEASKPAAGKKFGVGDDITYTITVKNTGNVKVTDVEVADALAGAVFVPGTTGLTEANDKVEIGDLDPGEQLVLTYTYEVQETDIRNGSIRNVALAAGKDGETPVTAEDEAVVDDDLEEPDYEGLIVRKVPNKRTVTVGDTITYTITVKNNGNVALYGVMIEETLKGAKFVDLPQGIVPVEADGKQTVTIPTLAAKAELVLKVEYQTEAAGKVKNAVLVTEPDEQPVEVPSDEVEVVEQNRPALTVTKIPYKINGVYVKDQIHEVDVGDTVTWLITVENTGNVRVDEILVEDIMTVHKLVEDYDITENDFGLDPGETKELTFSYKVQPFDEGHVLRNFVEAKAHDGSGARDDDVDESFWVEDDDYILPTLNKKDHLAYIIGYEDSTVRPQNSITRAEVATIFFRLMDDDTRAYYWDKTNSFNDVFSGDWYNNAISTMENARIISGYPDGGFHPNASITRAEFAAIAARFSDVVYHGVSSFNDVLPSYWANDEIVLAEYLGWIDGYPDGSFRPSQRITRAEAMTLVNRVLERAVEAEHMHRYMIHWIDNKPSAWYYEAVQEATNSHVYTRLSEKVPGQSFYFEDWTEMIRNPDWEALEKTWSDANDQ